MIIYNLVIRIYYFFILVASAFNPKAKLWIAGRKNYFNRLSKILEGNSQKIIWMHCASVGEFEQGRPVLEEIKRKFSEHKILITFYSPSGYEMFKNSEGIDFVLYLPLDTQANAQRFLDLVKPSFVVFVKYEFWLNFLNEIKVKQIPAVLISAVFRKDQPFFKWYGNMFIQSLKAYKQLFVQDENSKSLLNEIGVSNATVNGDTRFDRVAKIASEAVSLPFIESFCLNKKVIVAGSTWPKDVELLVKAFHAILQLKNDLVLIIVPHEIDKTQMKRLEEQLLTHFTEKDINWHSTFDSSKQAKILVVDQMGILSKIYRYSSISYLGGGFGDGIHNILEAAVYGTPLIFGPNYHKFNEAKQMIDLKCAWSISNEEALQKLMKDLLIVSPQLATDSAALAKSYVSKNLGASREIIEYLTKL